MNTKHPKFKLISKYQDGLIFKDYYWVVQPINSDGLKFPSRFALPIPSYQFHLFSVGEEFHQTYFQNKSGKYVPYTDSE